MQNDLQKIFNLSTVEFSNKKDKLLHNVKFLLYIWVYLFIELLFNNTLLKTLLQYIFYIISIISILN